VPDLADLGWDDAWQAAFENAGPAAEPGRVAVQHRGAYDVLTASGERRSQVTSRLRRELERTELPVVGDWVALDEAGSITGVLPRRTTISRRAAHTPASGVSREQVIAANVDVVLVVAALGQEVDVRLLERYLALALESGAKPVVVLTKADLDPEPRAVAEAVAAIGGEVPIHIVSAKAEPGIGALRHVLGPGVTGALLGPSGVGKSTIVNALVEDARLATAEVAADGSGRHTTTRRELVLLPQGGLIIDNPGMREVHLWLGEGGLSDAFPDVAELAAQCRFADCRHETEPGCAVRAALESGELPAARWEAYRALERELAELAERLERRERSRARRGTPGAGAG
jgi:ribosome biogenesis GTPase